MNTNDCTNKKLLKLIDRPFVKLFQSILEHNKFRSNGTFR